MKYTTDQLRDMARQALKAKADGDIRYALLVATLCAKFGMMPDGVERKIKELANA